MFATEVLCVGFLVCLNISTRNNRLSTDLPCYLKNCHLSCILLSLGIVNLLTLFLICYDGRQCRKESLRLNNWLFLVLIWSGGWPSAWLALYVLNYRCYYNDESSAAVLLRKTQLLVSAVATSTPLVYLFLNAYYNE